jgi:hypothetical protein
VFHGDKEDNKRIYKEVGDFMTAGPHIQNIKSGAEMLKSSGIEFMGDVMNSTVKAIMWSPFGDKTSTTSGVLDAVTMSAAQQLKQTPAKKISDFYGLGDTSKHQTSHVTMVPYPVQERKSVFNSDEHAGSKVQGSGYSSAMDSWIGTGIELVNKGVDQMGDINIEVGGDCPRCGLAFGDINLGDATSEDVESLSRMLFQEVGASQLGSKSGREELAGVAYTALNRLKGGKRGSTLTDVITSGHGYGKQGNKRAYGTATDERLQGHEEEFAKVRSFAKDVIAGKVSNPVGASTMFYHDTKGKGYGKPGDEQYAVPPATKSMKNITNINNARFFASKGKDVPERSSLDAAYTKKYEEFHGHKSE